MHYLCKKFFGLTILANIVYFPFNGLLHAFIHLNTPISDVLCVHVASSVFFALPYTIRGGAFKPPIRNFALTHLILDFSQNIA